MITTSRVEPQPQGAAPRGPKRDWKTDPKAIMFWMGYMLPAIHESLWTICRLAIPDRLKEGPKTCEELAALCRAHTPSLNRLLRALASIGIFRVNKRKQYALTPMSIFLCSDHPSGIYEWTMLTCMSRAPLEQLLPAVQTGASPVMLAFGQDCWGFLKGHPEAAALFDQAMSKTTRQQVQAILGVYDFSPYRTIVDVGCGRGALLTGILNTCPESYGVFYDRQEVVAETEVTILNAGISEQCEVRSGSFLAEVPPGAELYLLKHVLHDWDDEHALQLLTNIRQAMPHGSRLLVIEGLVDPDPNSDDVLMKWWDVTQMLTTFGQSRQLDEFQSLFERAGLLLEAVIPSAVADATLMQIVRADAERI